MLSRKLSSKKRRTIHYILFLIISLIVMIFLADRQIRPMVYSIAEYEGKKLATEAVHNAVLKVLEEEKITYSNLISLNYKSDGELSSLETNTVLINILQSKISLAVNKELKELSEYDLKLHVGTLSGITYLYGKGPNFKFRIQPVGSLSTEFISEFSSAGLNQTSHKIVLEIKASANAVVPLYQKSFDVITEFLVADTIIVGNIPDSFTNIVGDNRGILSKWNDYK